MVLGVFLLDLPAYDFSTVVYHLVDEFGQLSDLSEETRVEILRSLFLPHKYVDAINTGGNMNLGGIRRRLSRSATRASIHKLPEVCWCQCCWSWWRYKCCCCCCWSLYCVVIQIDTVVFAVTYEVDIVDVVIVDHDNVVGVVVAKCLGCCTCWCSRCCCCSPPSF